MKSLQDTLRSEESPTAQRILAIDDELEALERVRPKSWILIYGSVIVALTIVVGMIGVLKIDPEADLSFIRDLAFFIMTIIGAPSAVLAYQLLSNHKKKRCLERELDALIGGQVKLPPAPSS